MLFDSLMAADTSSVTPTSRVSQIASESGSQPLAAFDPPSESPSLVATAQTFNILIDISSLNSGIFVANVTLVTSGGNFSIPVSVTVPDMYLS
jgi:hypothetical protein